MTNERSTHSSSVSQKIGLPKKISQPMSPQQKNYSTNNSNDGCDRNPPKGRLYKSHKLQVKRKRQGTLHEEENIIPEGEIKFQYMDLDINIEDIEFEDDEQRLQESRKLKPIFQLKNIPFQKINLLRYKIPCFKEALKI